MIQLTVNADEALQDLEALPQRVRFALEIALRQAANETKASMQAKAPRYTGALAESITVTEQDPLHYSVQPMVPYAQDVVEGSRRSDLAGKQDFLTILAWTKQKLRPLLGKKERARALAIMKNLREKGSIPNPFVDRTVEEMEPKITALVERILQEALR